MFLSSDELNRAYGVDPRIARTYVDRPVPAGNAYWKGRLLYMPPVPGFLFMPVFSDLCLRCGISAEALLSEECLSLAERILDSAARLEEGMTDWSGHIRECLQMAEGNASGMEAWHLLRTHLEQGGDRSPVPLRTDFPSLKRADGYLLSLCPLSPDEGTFMLAASAWRSLMCQLLVQDDLSDIREDIERGQENAFIEAGLTPEGADRVMSLVDGGLDILGSLNPVLAERLMERRKRLDTHSILGPYFH
jgi:hypothetical protein